MGWKAALRSMEASARRAEREAIRHRRELERRQKEIEKMQELQRAAYEVDVFNNEIAMLKTMHQDCGEPWKWLEVKNLPFPEKPEKSNQNERTAQSNFDNYKPGFFDKLLKKTDKKIAALADKVKKAKIEDESIYQNALEEFEKEKTEWLEYNQMATGILKGDREAYIKAINTINPLREITNIGSSIDLKILDSTKGMVRLGVNSDEVIPNQTKSLLTSGKLSVKQMPKGEFNELYQDYVCSCVLRVAREIFALLPLEELIINALGNLLNTSTGYVEEQPILSVKIIRRTLNQLNFSMIDPSDSMRNFIHNMSFSRNSGFKAVTKLEIQ